jgi:hypothetical protein
VERRTQTPLLPLQYEELLRKDQELSDLQAVISALSLGATANSGSSSGRKNAAGRTAEPQELQELQGSSPGQRAGGAVSEQRKGGSDLGLGMGGSDLGLGAGGSDLGLGDLDLADEFGGSLGDSGSEGGGLM